MGFDVEVTLSRLISIVPRIRRCFEKKDRVSVTHK